jgi:hypothetical protein
MSVLLITPATFNVNHEHAANMRRGTNRELQGCAGRDTTQVANDLYNTRGCASWSFRSAMGTAC